jgi:hypothetical protein
MKLKRHREDVRDLKLMQDNYVQEIARRYQRLIYLAECHFHSCWTDADEMWPQEKRVLKDAEK